MTQNIFKYTQKSLKKQKQENILRNANISDTLIDQKSPVHQEADFRNGTHTHDWRM